jgi:hypothetical protein
MRTRSLILALAVVALAAPADASAHLPLKGGRLIVPGKSIGRVKLGMTAERAANTWGKKGGSCSKTTVGAVSCRYEAGKQGSARFDIGSDGKVQAIYIESGHKSDGTAIYKGAISQWTTVKGIGIGSSLQRVVKKYPKAKPDGGGVEIATAKSTTFFAGSEGRTYRIAIVAASAL